MASPLSANPSFLWIDEAPRPGWANMALDLALLDRAEHHDESWLRVYTWDPHCLSFGRHEPARRLYDRERVGRLGLDTVRRPTGGRAVWHAAEVTYAVAAPCTRFGSLRAAYREIHQLLSRVLQGFGVEATLAPRAPTAALDAGACFAQPVGGEVMVGGRKVIGSAQLRRGSGLLQHGSILLRDEQQLVTSLLGGAETVASRFSGLGSEDHPVCSSETTFSAQDLAAAVARLAARSWAGSWDRVIHPSSVLQAAERHYPQFRSPAWTWAR